jgi:hypothetical protein
MAAGLTRVSSLTLVLGRDAMSLDPHTKPMAAGLTRVSSL